MATCHDENKQILLYVQEQAKELFKRTQEVQILEAKLSQTPDGDAGIQICLLYTSPSPRDS